MKILIEKKALKTLSKIPNPDAKNISNKIKNLSKNPLPPRHKKLKGTNLFRIRCGNYRVLYTLEKDQNIIKIAVISRTIPFE